jgi:hypothetical protein
MIGALMLARVFIGLVAFAWSIADVSVAKASIVYSYTGDPFSTFFATPGASAGAFVGQSVSGEFTVAAPLGDNFNGVVTPTQFSFFSGLIPINNFSSSAYNFNIQTSDIGDIIDWSISLQHGTCSPGCISIQTSNVRDFTSSRGPTTFISASNTDTPGTWSSAIVTPLPAGLPLFASGLGLLGLVCLLRGRRKGNGLTERGIRQPLLD